MGNSDHGTAYTYTTVVSDSHYPPPPGTPYPAPCTLNPTSCTLNPIPRTPHPAPCTLHPTPRTLHPITATPKVEAAAEDQIVLLIWSDIRKSTRAPPAESTGLQGESIAQVMLAQPVY